MVFSDVPQKPNRLDDAGLGSDPMLINKRVSRDYQSTHRIGHKINRGVRMSSLDRLNHWCCQEDIAKLAKLDD
jgi:hypothetical protein